MTGGSEAESYRFDVDGRVEEITREGSTLTLEHDTYDRLIQAGSVSYSYDGMNRRVRSTGPVERNFLVAPAMGSGLESVHQVVDGAGNKISEYVYAGMMPLLRKEANSPVYYLTNGMGSVIGLANEFGEKIDNFNYDGFGNLRSSVEEVPIEAGGDFRFHGQWLEASTGLYHLRARDYDPITGRFFSQDLLEPIQEEPQSGNPYQFAYQNPQVYTDPEGLFAIFEINVGQKIQDILRKAQVQAYGTVKQKLIDQAQGSLGELINDVIWNLIPGEGIFPSVFSNNIPINQGTQFEYELSLNICSLIFGDYSTVFDILWLQVPVDLQGNPRGNGFGCRVAKQDPTIFKPGNLGKAVKGPDFLFKKGLPFSTDKNPKAYLIGEIGITVSRIWSKFRGRRPQAKAILNYAKYTNNHQYLPIALFVTFFGGEDNVEEKIEKEALRDYGVVAVVASVLDTPR